MRWVPLAAPLVGCQGLDRVPIVVGEHCASARVAEVACTLDGDTFQVDSCGGESVRLLGVDAPEIAHSAEEEADCWGPESAQWLEDFLESATVLLEFDAECQDDYGRTLAYAWLEVVDEENVEAILINEEIIRQGQARVYEAFDDINLADTLYTAEGLARDENLGLWAACE